MYKIIRIGREIKAICSKDNNELMGMWFVTEIEKTD